MRQAAGAGLEKPALLVRQDQHHARCRPEPPANGHGRMEMEAQRVNGTGTALGTGAGLEPVLAPQAGAVPVKGKPANVKEAETRRAYPSCDACDALGAGSSFR